MLIGDSGVGKTCILVRFKNNTFSSHGCMSTVGIDFKVSADYLLLQTIFVGKLIPSIIFEIKGARIPKVP